MSIPGLSVVRMRALAVVAPLACCCALAATIASSGAAAGGGDVTLRHKSSGFSIRAPRGSELAVRRGVYVIKSPGLTVSFSRSVTAITPSPVRRRAARSARRGDRLAHGEQAPVLAEVNVGTRREIFVARRAGAAVAVTTGTSSLAAPVALATIERIAASARGGIALRPPKTRTKPVKPLAMRSYRAPDGGATAQVPAGSAWQIESSQGALAGASKQGSFVLGFSINIFLPTSVPNGGAGTSALVSPYCRRSARCRTSCRG